MQTRIKALVLLFVPILGLSSCSKDRKLDDWKMSEPTIIASGATPLKFTAAESRRLPNDAYIQFADQDWSSLSIESKCTFDGRSFSGKSEISPRPQLPLKLLWPAELWKTLSDADLQRSECAFNFVATNKNGSTQDFALSRIQLSTFVSEFAKPDVSGKVASLSSRDSMNPLEAHTLVNEMAGDFSNQSTFRLVCGSIAAELTAEALSRNSNPIEALMQMTGLRGRQMCHFVVAEKAQPLGLPRYTLTADANMKFPRVNLLITAEFPFTTMPAHPQQEVPILRLVVSNESETDGYLAPIAPLAVTTRFVSFSAQSAPLRESSYLETANVDILLDGVSTIDKVIKIAAHSTVAIDIIVPVPGLTHRMVPNFSGTNIAGVRFGFLGKIRLNQIDDPASLADALNVWSSLEGAINNQNYSSVLPNFQNLYGLTFDGQNMVRSP